MPQLANVTVKKNDGTTDIVWTGVVPSGGDKSPAVWRSNTVGTAMSHRPEFRTVSRENGTGTGRRVDASFVYKTLATADGVTTAVSQLPISISALVPKDMPDADVLEAVSQCFNLLDNDLIKSQFTSGYAAN